MFESDDFDQVLSQFDFPEVETGIANTSTKSKADTNSGLLKNDKPSSNLNADSIFKSVKPTSRNPYKYSELSEDQLYSHNCSQDKENKNNEIQSIFKSSKARSPNKNSELCVSTADTQDTRQGNENENNERLELKTSFTLPKHTKRKIIDSYFDHQSKRKFPGPAGLLAGNLKEPKDDNICQIELFSQDIDYAQNNLHRAIFESPIWNQLMSDAQCDKLAVDSINTIKQQALSGNLRRRKAQNVAAFVEAVDKSAIDPLIILRDTTGSIKCTLHRDAWSTFSQYIVSEYCALILHKPTVLTTGGAFKKHYLNITLSNILAVYSANVNEDGNKTLPEGYSIVNEGEFTVIKTEKCSDSLGTSLELAGGAEDITEGLDSFFSEDLF